jgi:phage gp36-like protein
MYTTLAAILERIPEETVIQLTDDAGAGVVDQTKVDAAIARAGQEIDAWCGTRYRVPFDPAPAVVAGLAADLAIYYLYGRTVEEIPEARKDAHKNALRLLEKISIGQVSLGIDPAPAATSASGAAVVSGNSRQFSRDKLRDM